MAWLCGSSRGPRSQALVVGACVACARARTPGAAPTRPCYCCQRHLLCARGGRRGGGGGKAWEAEREAEQLYRRLVSRSDEEEEGQE